MRSFFLIFIVISIYSCKNEEPYYFYGKEQVIELDNDITTVYNVRDSSKYILNEEFSQINSCLEDKKCDSISFYSKDENFYYSSFKNEVSINELDGCWTLKNEDYEIELELISELGKYNLYLNQKLYEKGNFIISNDFNKFYTLIIVSDKFFADDFYIINFLSRNSFQISNLDTKKKLLFSA